MSCSFSNSGMNWIFNQVVHHLDPLTYRLKMIHLSSALKPETLTQWRFLAWAFFHDPWGAAQALEKKKSSALLSGFSIIYPIGKLAPLLAERVPCTEASEKWKGEGGRGGGGQFTSPKWVLRGGLARRVIQCRTATALTWPTCNSSRLQETRLSRMCFSFRKWITTRYIMPFSSLVTSYGILFRRSDPGLQIATLIYFTFLF